MRRGRDQHVANGGTPEVAGKTQFLDQGGVFKGVNLVIIHEAVDSFCVISCTCVLLCFFSF